MKKIKNFIKKSYLSVIHSIFNYLYGWIRLEILLQKNNLNVVSRKNLIKKIKTNKKICHIIGSGESLKDTKKIIEKDDFVIGFNFSALSELDFDIYMVEFFGPNSKEISDIQLKVVKKFLKKSTILIFKHLIHERNSINYLLKNYKAYNFFVLKDVLLTCSSKFSHEFLCKKLLFKTRIFNQFSSSVIVALDIANSLNFDKIILHGVDLEGPYFFQNNTKFKDYLPFDSFNYKKLKKNKPHQVNVGNFSLLKTLELLNDNNDFSKIYTAKKNHHLNHLFRVYEKKI